MIKKIKTCVSVLQDRASNTPHQIACLLLGDGTNETAGITFGELNNRAKIIAAHLQEKSLPSKQILLVYSNGLDFISAFFGCLYAGITAVPMAYSSLAKSQRLSSQLLAVVDDAKICGVLSCSKILPEVEKIIQEHENLANLFLLNTTQLENTSASKYVSPDISPDQLAYLQYTSGSTSAPKAAMISHGNLLENVIQTSKAWHFKNNSVSFSWAPHHHIYGLVCGLLMPILRGKIAIIMPPEMFLSRPLSWLEAISKYKVTHSGCPNFGYDLCLHQIHDTDLVHLNLRHWKVAVNGGERVLHDTLVKFSQKFSSAGFSINHFCSAYGMSEASGAIASSRYGKQPRQYYLDKEALKNNKASSTNPKNPSAKFISSGRLVPGFQAIIVDPETLRIVEKNTIGEIWLAGKSIAGGYWRKPDITNEFFLAQTTNSNKKYFRTGDLGFIAKNEICITGRLNEVLNIHGKKYYPLDLEISVHEALKTNLAVGKNIVFSVPQETESKIVFLQEISSELIEHEKLQLIQLIRRVITEHHGIDLNEVDLIAMGSLQTTASGKMQRKLIQKNYIDGLIAIDYSHAKREDPHPSALIEAESILQEVILQGEVLPVKPLRISEAEQIKPLFQIDFILLLAEVLKINRAEIALNNAMSAYGFDSVNLVNLANRLNEKFQLKINPTIVYQYSTIGSFYEGIFAEYIQNVINYYQKKSEKIEVTPEPSETHVLETKQLTVSEDIIVQPPLATVQKPSLDIAIVGMQALVPGASDIEEFWQNLLAGEDAITTIPSERWDWQQYYGDPQSGNKTHVKWGGFIKGIAEFDAAFFNISPREAELIDPQQRIFLQIVWKAIEDAGYAAKTLQEFKTGLFVGVFNNDYAELLHDQQINDAYVTTGITHSTLANRISYLLNLTGPSMAIDTACSSSLVALHQAIQAIHNGDCQFAIVGGVNAILTPTVYISASKAGMLSEDGRCKTFDDKANGYVRSEGAAAIVIRPLQDALQSGDQIYAVIKGSAINHGGHVSSLTVPNPNAQAELIAAACTRANIAVESIGFIETHGTGTSLGDPVEINGLKKAFVKLAESQGNKILPAGYCGLGSVKTNIGHLESAAGIVGVIKTVLALKHRLIPANLHFEHLNPYIEIQNSPFYIVNENKFWQRIKENDQEYPLRAGVSSFGFGGANAHVILEEFSVEEKKSFQLQPAYIITISAKSMTALQNRVIDLGDWLQANNPDLAFLSFTLNHGREHFTKRCAFVVASIEELKLCISELQLGKTRPNSFIQGYVAAVNKIADEEQFIKNLKSSSSLQLRELLNDLAVHYCNGHDFGWQQLYDKSEMRRISVPTYSFDKTEYWLPKQNIPEIKAEIVAAESVPATTEFAEQNDLNKKPILHLISDDIAKITAEIVKINPANIQLQTVLTELGFDSISFKELAGKIENYYQIKVLPTQFYTHLTVEAISTYLLKNHINQIIGRYKQPFIKKAEEIIPRTVAKEIDAIAQEKHPQLLSEDIAIISMQGMFPQSKNIAEFWQNLLAGKDLITEIPPERWNWQAYYGDAKQDVTKTNSKWGGFIPDVDRFDAGFFNISGREANLMDPQQRLLLEVVWDTIEQAGYDPNHFAEQSVGVFVGAEFSDYTNLLASQQITHGLTATGNSSSIIANRISYTFNFHGPSEVIHTACSSSLVAIHRAVNALRNSECKAALACGVSLILDPEIYVKTSQLNVLSADGHCKTFDASADGYVKGEGIAALLLKPLDQAVQDKDFILGVIKGVAVNHGGKAQSLTAPNAASQAEVISAALAQAAVDPRSISYIEAHGTGTELGDPIEIEGLKQVFNAVGTIRENTCGVGSVKTNIGHLEPASGIASVIKVLLALQHQTIPKTIHQKNLNPYIDLKNTPFFIASENYTWRAAKNANGKIFPRRAGISSFGFGGTNSHLILEEYFAEASIANPEKQRPYYLVILSTKKAESLPAKITDLHAWLSNTENTISLANLSYTLSMGRTHFDSRCVIIASTLEELKAILQSLTQSETNENCFISTDPKVKYSGPVVDEIYKTVMSALNSRSELSSGEYREKLLLLADLFCKYYPVQLSLLYQDENLSRVHDLPSYPFEKERHWFDLELTKTVNKLSPILSVQKPLENIDVSSQLIDYLQHLFAAKLSLTPQQITPEDTYENFGVDSILGLEITNSLEQDFGDLPKTLLYEKNTLLDLSGYLLKKYPAAINRLFHAEAPVQDIQVVKPDIIKQEVNPLLSISPPRDSEDIAIIGLSGIFPLANDMDEFWQNLLAGRDCITEVPGERWNYHDYPVQVGAETKYFKYGGFIPDVDKFDPLFFSIAPNDANLMDPQERLFLQTAWNTFEDAGYTREKLQKIANNNVGVFVGVTYNFYPLFIAEEWAKGNRLPLDIQMFSVANRVSYFMNFNGPSYPIDTACSSSLAAIHQACLSLKNNECKMALAGGVNLTLHPSKYHFLGSYSFMSDQGQCASFAEGGNGYVPSEGTGAILLKPLSAAIRDQDRIYGVIKASSMNHGGKTSGYTVPNPNAQADLVRSALQQAKINPRTISYIEAHGTGTALGDPIEIRGLQEAFEDYTQEKQFCAIGSVKSNIGHLESAAGISQLAKVLLQMRHKTLVPSIHAEKLNHFIKFDETPFRVQRELSAWLPIENNSLRAGISSFGAGGTNVHLIVDEYKDPYVPEKISMPLILVLSALNHERLREYAEKILKYIEAKQPSPSYEFLQVVCYTLQTGRESFSARLAIYAENADSLLKILRDYVANNLSDKTHLWTNEAKNDSIPTVAQQTISQWINERNYTDLSRYWVNGNKIQWQEFYRDATLRCISLPTYPFAKRRCWVPSKTVADIPLVQAPVQVPAVEKQVTEFIAKQYDPKFAEQWIYSQQWVSKKLENQSAQFEGKWLIFTDKELGFHLQDTLGKDNCIYCFAGNQFMQFEGQVFYINPDQASDYVQLIQSLQDTLPALTGIIYLSGFSQESINDFQATDLSKIYDKAENSSKLYYLFQALVQANKTNLRFCLVTQNSQSVLEGHPVNIWEHHFWSFARIFVAEHANYSLQLIDLDDQKNLRADAEHIAAELQNYDANDYHIAYRQNERYVIRLKSSADFKRVENSIIPDAVLISGGLGALGMELVKYLMQHGTRYFLLVGTKPLPERSTWGQLQDKELLQKVKFFQEMEQAGIQVSYCAADICNKLLIETAATDVQSSWKKPITGVFHLAGITTDNLPIEKMTVETLQKVVSIKAQGALVLHDIFRSPNLQCFVMYSSIAALPYFGMRGLSAYAMANEFLDGIAAYRRSLGLVATSINWAAWAEVGMSFEHQHNEFLDAVGMTPITTADGMHLLQTILNLQLRNPGVFKINWDKFLQVNVDARKFKFFTEFHSHNPKIQVIQKNISHQQVEDVVFGALNSMLGLDANEINVDEPLQNYGMDSIIGVNFVNKINESFANVIAPMDLYRYSTANKLIEHISRSVLTEPEPAEEKLAVIEVKLSVQEAMAANSEHELSYDELNDLLEKELKDIKL